MNIEIPPGYLVRYRKMLDKWGFTVRETDALLPPGWSLRTPSPNHVFAVDPDGLDRLCSFRSAHCFSSCICRQDDWQEYLDGQSE